MGYVWKNILCSTGVPFLYYGRKEYYIAPHSLLSKRDTFYEARRRNPCFSATGFKLPLAVIRITDGMDDPGTLWTD